MNRKQIEEIKKDLKKGFKKLTEEKKLIFRLVYFRGNIKTSMDKLIDNMITYRLNQALQHIQNNV